MLTKRVCLFRHNARPYVARDTKVLPDKFGWDIVPHPRYSSDLAASDYHLFFNLKRHSDGKRLNSDEEVKIAVKDYLGKEMDGMHYDGGIKKLPDRLQRASI